MKFEVSSKELFSKLQVIGKVISSKSPLPIMSHILFTGKEGGILKVAGADPEIRIEAEIKAEGITDGFSFTLPADKLIEPLKKLPSQTLRFEINEETMATVVRYGNGKFNLSGMKGELFPSAKKIRDDSAFIPIDSRILLSGISGSSFAVADDELRPVMNGIYFDMLPDGLTLVASNGFQLVRLRNKSIKCGGGSSFILPGKPSKLIGNILLKDEGMSMIRSDGNNAYFTGGGFEMSCRLIEGRYPNYESVIPKEKPYKLVLDCIPLQETLKRVSNFSKEGNLVKLRLKAETLEVFAEDRSLSMSALERVPCRYDGPEMEICFNYIYLLGILSAINCESIVLGISNPSHSIVIEPETDDGDWDFLSILVPVIVQD